MSGRKSVFRFLLSLGVLLYLISSVQAAPAEEYGKVEVLRDRWGIPHVFSDTDAGAMYGLGYATAQDRCFQMYYRLRTMQGRLGEVIGDAQTAGGRNTALASDRLMRTMGFYRAAVQVAENLDPEAKLLLQAYSDGVNGYLNDNRSDLHYLFAKTGLEPEPWTPSASMVIWWHTAKWFASDGLRDQISVGFRKIEREGAQEPIIDDDAAVVKREDVTDEWIAEVNAFMDKHGLKRAQADSNDPPKFSHAWIISGRKTTTGSAVMVSDPQTPVWNPSFFYEFHVSGKTFNARGIGAAGSPIILIGFNENVAWGMTALGADQADLFLLKTDAEHPDQYEYDGEWRDMKVREETIEVKDGDPETITTKETHHGPVVTAFAFGVPAGREVALRRVPICESDRETIQGALGMMRAGDVHEFAAALPGWRFPTANVVFGDREGNIGYWSLGALPVRSAKGVDWGNYAHDGSSSEWEWQDMIPYHLLPHVINPERGYLVSANHRTIQSFYQLTLGTSTGSFGETDRGLRIKEKIWEHLAEKDLFTPEEVLAIQYDSVNVAKREIVRLGYYIRGKSKGDLSPASLRALDYLEDWHKKGAQSDTSVKGTELVNEMRIIFRAGVFPLARVYGGGGSGLASFAKTISKRFAENPEPRITFEEISFVDAVLRSAWGNAVNEYGADPEQWHDKAIESMQYSKLPYFQSLERFPSLDEQFDVTMPILTVTDGSTIWSQRGQSYTQYVPLHDVDSAKSIMPIGQSERPDSPYRFSTYSDWGKGILHNAPLSREKVEAIKIGQMVLSGESKSMMRERGERDRRGN